MPFGIAPASEIFQKKLEQALEGLEGIRNIHDIVIWGEGETLQDAIVNHDRRLYKLLERCEERGIALNESDKKFILRTPTLPYMGHIFTADGLKIDRTRSRQSHQCRSLMDRRAFDDSLEWPISFRGLCQICPS